MGIYKFIKIRGPEARRTGYFVPRMYGINLTWKTLKLFGLQYLMDRLNGWTVWWVGNKTDFDNAIKTLDELKKTRIFDYRVGK